MPTTYSIKEVATMFDLSISTIHYYDKQGLLPFVDKNASGYRAFTQSDLNFIHTICCLKDTGMPIKTIKTYINLCMAGPDTIPDRRALLTAHKQAVLAKQAKLEASLAEIDDKLDRYNDPAARQLIETEINYVTKEKAEQHLANPFYV